MSERLQKVISRAGLMSRRAAEVLIAEGRIAIDDRIAVLGDRVDPATQRVFVDGVPIPIAPVLRTYLVNKPVGVISTADDPQGRWSVRTPGCGRSGASMPTPRDSSSSATTGS